MGLTERRVHTTLPAADLERARHFYEDRLGFKPDLIGPGGVRYVAGEGTAFVLYPTQGTPSGGHTQLGFTVTDLEAEVAALKAAGVVFEVYDFPGFDAATSMATAAATRAAWFKDSEGNLIGMVEFMAA